MKVSKIISIFFQTVLFIAGTMIIVAGSNLLIKKVFSDADTAQVSAIAEELKNYNINKSVDTIPVSAIYAVNRDNSAIEHIVLEVMNCETRRLTYISIPCSSRLTISDDLYRELTAQVPQFPQIVTLAEGCHYYDDISGIAAIDRIISEITGIKLSSSLALPTDIFESVFLAQESKEGLTTGFALPFIEELAGSRGGSVYDMLTELSTEAYSTNISLQDKLLYLETYDSIFPGDVAFITAPGNLGVSSFEIDSEALRIILYSAIYRQ